MYEVRVEKIFRATHAVRLPGGAMEPPHEHDWRVTAILRGSELGEDGFLIDFCLVQRELDRIVDPLSGGNMNEHPFLAGMSPSAEAVARQIFEALVSIEWGGADLAGVAVVEAPGCSVLYSRPAGAAASNVGKE